MGIANKFNDELDMDGNFVHPLSKMKIKNKIKILFQQNF
jgi:hypothetical protein